MKFFVVIAALIFSLTGRAQNVVTPPVKISQFALIHNTFNAQRVITDSIQYVTAKIYLVKDSIKVIGNNIFYPAHLVATPIDSTAFDKNSIADLILVEERSFKSVIPGKMYPSFTLVYSLKLNEVFREVTDKVEAAYILSNVRYYFTGSLKQGTIFFY